MWSLRRAALIQKPCLVYSFAYMAADGLAELAPHWLRESAAAPSAAACAPCLVLTGGVASKQVGSCAPYNPAALRATFVKWLQLYKLHLTYET